MKTRRLLLFSLLVIALLVGGCSLWVWQAKRQYALNRQLITALVGNDTKQALALVNAGADPNTRKDPPPAPTFKLLLDQLLHRSVVSVNGSPTALHLACGAYSTERIQHDVRMPRLSTYHEDVPLVNAMLAHGALVNSQMEGGDTPLHWASITNSVHTMELLLQHGGNVNAQNGYGDTPLMNPACYGKIEMTHLLLTHGANPNMQNKMGRTPLLNAVLDAVGAEVISDLLVHGADPMLRDKNGDMPLEMAQVYKDTDLVRLLTRRGGK